MKKLYFFILLITSFGYGIFAQPNGQTNNQEQFVINKAQTKKTTLKPRFYYYPNLNAYFDLVNKIYIYKVNGEWIKSDRIASNYRGYSSYNKYYIVIEDYFGDNPQELITEHCEKYPSDFKGNFLKKSQNSSLVSN